MRQRQSDPSETIRNLALDGIWTAVLVLLGMVKLPSLVPGAEFQLSAPYAVCLAATVGFQRYLGIGICSSVIQLMFGTHTLWNVATAMVFRVVAGGMAAGQDGVSPGRGRLLLAGPAGTACARLMLAAVLQVPAAPLLAAAVPGMVFTAVCASFLYPVFRHAAAQGTRMACRQRTGGKGENQREHSGGKP